MNTAVKEEQVEEQEEERGIRRGLRSSEKEDDERRDGGRIRRAACQGHDALATSFSWPLYMRTVNHPPSHLPTDSVRSEYSFKMS